MSFHNLPDELKDYSSWVMWKYEYKDGPDKAPDKVLCNVRTGNYASVTDPISWSDFTSCVQAYEASQRGEIEHRYAGLGFVFSDRDPYFGVDLDNAYDPSKPLSDEQRAAIQARQLEVFHNLQTYAELSPSGKGLHIIGKGHVPNGRRRNFIEVYSKQRFFTMTGNVYRPLPIAECQAQVAELWESLAPPRRTEHGGYTGSQQALESDQAVYERALRAANGDKFAALWAGDVNAVEGNDKSLSAVDQALTNILAYYTPNKEQVERLWLASPVGQREKTQSRAAYRDWTINLAYDRTVPPVDIDGLANGLRDAIARREAEEAEARRLHDAGIELNPKYAVKDASNVYTRPPGLLGEIADYIYSAAYRPVPEIALAGAIGLMAGICGRAFNVSNSGLNQYVLLLADTGSGKEAMSSGINKLVAAVQMAGAPTVKDFIGPSLINSGQALLKHVADAKTASCVCLLGEFAVELKRITHPHAPPSDMLTRRALLDLFHKSGQGEVLQGSIYSDKAKNIEAIEAPALSILGDAPPADFYDSIDEQMIGSGLVPRLTIITYTGKRVYGRENYARDEPPAGLVQRFAALVAQAATMNHQRAVVTVVYSRDAAPFLREFELWCDDQINASPEQVVKHLWNRAHIKTLRLAALVAVGVNPHHPVIELEHAQWAKNIIVRDTQELLARFARGDISSGGEEGKQQDEVLRIIREYVVCTRGDVASYGFPLKMHDEKIVPYAYLNKRLVAGKLFKRDRAGATNAIKRAINSLTESGKLTELSKTQMTERFGTGQRGFMITDFSILNQAAE